MHDRYHEMTLIGQVELFQSPACDKQLANHSEYHKEIVINFVPYKEPS